MRTLQTWILNWMQESLESFVAEVTLTRSDKTSDAYRYDVEQFLAYLKDKGVKRAKFIKPEHIIGYLSHCKSQGKSDSSVNRYYMSIRAYMKHLRKTKRVEKDIMQDISPPKNVQKAPRVPTIEEIGWILDQPNVSNESGKRDRAILELLYSSGLRASELCDLQLDDYRDISITVRCGKRGKARTVPLTPEASKAIREYIEMYRGKEPGHLFQTLLGKKLGRQLLCKQVMLYAQKAGVDDVTTHTLRHACATHLLDQGADLRLIQEVLGHSSIASTQRYTQLSTNKMQSMFQQFHPRKTQPIGAHV